MATETRRQELQGKIKNLVASRFAGNYDRGFAHYDRNGDGRICRAELLALLADAGIGNWLTRGIWADGILTELDTDKDGAISLAEFQSVLV